MCEVGEIFLGYCEGYFGRDVSYSKKRVEAFGADWIVARGEYGEIFFARFSSREEKNEAVARWRNQR